MRSDNASELASAFACSACGGALTTSEGKSVRCEGPQCGAVFRVEGGIPDFLGGVKEADARLDEVEEDFVDRRKVRGPLSEFVGEQVHDLIARWLHGTATELGGALRVLDLGCGEKLNRPGGWDYHALIGQDCQVYYGIDPSWEALRKSAEPGSDIDKFQVGLLARAAGERLPLADESVDAVLMVSVLDHCVDPERVMEECNRVLRPGGSVMVVSGARLGWQFEVVRRVWPQGMKKRELADHHNHLTTRDVADMMASAGYSGLELREFGYVCLPPQGRGIEKVVYALGSGASIGRKRLGRMIARADKVASRRFPGRGTTFAAVGRKDGESGKA